MLAAGMTVRVARLPEGEDPDSLLRSRGAEAFRECLDNAVSVVVFQIAVARSRESNPDSYDAIARTGQAVLELVKKCPGAVMRAGFMQEAATLLRIPVSALEEDLAKLNVGVAARPKAVSRAEPEKLRPVEDASASANNPPPGIEMALMEFLFGLGADAQIADMLESYAPDNLFAHHVTMSFVRAYVRETRGDVDAIVNCKNEIPSNEVQMLEEVFLSQNRAARSELEPADNLRKVLCRLWFDAVCRRLKALPMEGDPELTRRRSGLSMLSRKFKTMPWHVASQSMRSETLLD
jgi:DNA primase